MFVHLMKAIEHGAKIVGADGEHGRKADGGVHGERATTQTQKPENVGGVISKGELFAVFVETKPNFLATGDYSARGRPWRSHSRAVCALVIVSNVAKVFEETMNKVSAGLRSWGGSTKSAPSTFETKRKLRLRLE